jgi:non-homologous end joining protein Ku
MRIIKAKMKGKEPDLKAPAEPRQADVVDLMERLRQSLQGARGAPAKKKARARKTTARAKRKRAA